MLLTQSVFIVPSVRPACSQGCIIMRRWGRWAWQEHSRYLSLLGCVLFFSFCWQPGSTLLWECGSALVCSWRKEFAARAGQSSQTRLVTCQTCHVGRQVGRRKANDEMGYEKGVFLFLIYFLWNVWLMHNCCQSFLSVVEKRCKHMLCLLLFVYRWQTLQPFYLHINWCRHWCSRPLAYKHLPPHPLFMLSVMHT